MKSYKSLPVILFLIGASISMLPGVRAGFSTTPQLPRPGDKVKEVVIGSAAPDWRLKTVEGETVALSELRGKVVVLDFWANWCGPCRKLEPLFDRLAHEYRSKPVKFFTLSVWPDQDFNPQAYLKERKLASAFLIGDDAVASDYGIWGVPTYFVIDPAGKVSYLHVLLSVDPESLERRLREAIEKALFSTASAVGSSSQESDRDRKRDEWQRPAEVMDALGVKPGSRVADIGCGSGYFTFRLAARVGAEGKVYAADIDREAIDKVRRRKEREKLEQVEPILGESADPRLPGDLDAVLIVDSYHEFREYDQTLQAVFRALKPGGRFVIIDGEAPSGRPRTEYHRLHTIPAELVREEVVRHGFVFKESRPGFYDAEYGKKMYFLIFEKQFSPGDQQSASTSDCATPGRVVQPRAWPLCPAEKARSNKIARRLSSGGIRTAEQLRSRSA
jgi:predicted methyltransferase/thiol-disulfide isomerase/thioredoxin